MPMIVLAIASVALGAGLMGWHAAHQEVALECQRLGAFYVDHKTFECKEKK